MRFRPRSLTRAACLGACMTAAPAHADRAIVLSTDYQTGYYSSLDLSPPYAHTVNVGFACADGAVRVHGDRAYIVGRFACDHIQVLDATSLAILGQWSTGPGTNPQDIEVYSPTKAYISLYERDYILIANPQTGQELGRISLASFSDSDGLPEEAEMALVGDRLFVCMQRLDRPHGYIAANPSYIAVIDCTTDALVDVDPSTSGVQAIPLTGRNPFSELAFDPVREKLYVAEEGDFGALDGGAEFIDPVALQAEGFFITEAELGGDLNAVRLYVDCTGYAIVEDASFRTQLARFNRCTGTKTGVCWQSSGFDLCDVEIDRAGLVLLSDRDLVHPGVRLFQAPTLTQITTSPIGFGLPPCDLVPIMALSPTSAPPAGVAALRLFPNRPDPFNPSTTLRVEAPVGTAVRLEIFDVRGRLVRALFTGAIHESNRDFIWDGKDNHAAPLPSGVYMARLESSDQTQRERLTLVR